MIAGDVVLVALPQIGGPPKLRPAPLLTHLPGPYQNLLICGISTQTQLLQPNWDESIAPGDADFATSGLRRASAIRLRFLYAANANEVSGVIGSIDVARLNGLRQRLADLLRP